jgi:hypothetical protein
MPNGLGPLGRADALGFLLGADGSLVGVVVP